MDDKILSSINFQNIIGYFSDDECSFRYIQNRTKWMQLHFYGRFLKIKFWILIKGKNSWKYVYMVYILVKNWRFDFADFAENKIEFFNL